MLPSRDAGSGRRVWEGGNNSSVWGRSWHLGRMQVGLSQARRFVQCSSARITLLDTMPMQVPPPPSSLSRFSHSL